MRAWTWPLVLTLIACTGGGSDPSTHSADTGDPQSQQPNGGNTTPHSGDNGLEVPPDRDPDYVIEGDLAEGVVLDDLSWAQSNFCWPGTQNVNFNGAHVLYEYAGDIGPGMLPALTDVFLRVAPDAEVDVSLYYALRSGTSLPPQLFAMDCDAMADWTTQDNPGQAERICMPMHPGEDMNLLVGVAGAHGATSGGFTLQVWDIHPGDTCSQP